MKYENPYRDLSAEKLTRVQYYVSKSHHDFMFLQVHPGHGTLTTTVTLLFSKLYDALQRQGITSYSTQRDEYERFLAECVVGLPQDDTISRRTAGRPLSKTNAPNVQRGSKKLRTRPKVIKGKSTDVQGADNVNGDGIQGINS